MLNCVNEISPSFGVEDGDVAICGIAQCLAHILIFDFVFVAVFQVLAGHSPNKAVVAGSGSGVDAPFRRSDGLLVVQPYEAFLLGSPIKWQIALPSVTLK